MIFTQSGIQRVANSCKVEILLQSLLTVNELAVKNSLPQLEEDTKQLSARYQLAELSKLYRSLEKKHTDLSSNLEDSVQMWTESARQHCEFDGQVAACLQQLGDAERMDVEICRDAHELQSQLQLEAKVKVIVLT